MRWQDYSHVAAAVQDALPSGFTQHSYRTSNQDSLVFRIVEDSTNRVVLEKIYSLVFCSMDKMELLKIIMTDIQEFVNIQNSPLVKALK